MADADDRGAQIYAEVTVERDLNGQLAIGNNIVQVRIDAVHGDLVALPSGQIPVPRLRSGPVSILPHRPDPMFDRSDETARILADAAQGRPVAVSGPPGIGRSTLLRHVATQESLAATGGGVAFPPVEGLSRDDTLQAIFEVFYECDVPFKPSPTSMRHLLQGARAAIVLDDVGLTGKQIRELVDTAPACGFVVAADVEPNADIRSVRLTGLPLDDARRLFAHGLGRALEPGEFGDADALCELAGNEPACILGAAAGARESAVPLAELAASALRSGSAPSPTPTDADLRLLGFLAAVPGLTLDERHLAELSGLADVAQRLDRWVASGVVSAARGDPVTYRLRQGAENAAHWPIDQCRDVLWSHFTAWARDRRAAVLRPGVEVEALRLLQADAGRRSEWDRVLAVGALLDAAYAVGGRWDAWRDVAMATLEAAEQLGDRAAEALALHQLGTRELCLAGTGAALDLLGKALTIREDLGDGPGAAATRQNLSLITAPPVPPVIERPPGPRRRWKRLRTTAASAVGVAALVVAGLLIIGPSGSAVEFRPVAASFPDQPMNRSGAPQQLDLVNTGRVPLHLSEVRVTGEHAADFSVATTTCAHELAAGGTCTTTVVFTPTGEGARSAALTVAVAELDDEPQLPLSGAGSVPDPASVTVDPSVLTFDDQEVGTSGPVRSVRLDGPATGRVALGAAAVEGEHAADFATVSNGCSDVSLRPGRYCTVRIRFTPSSAGPRTALLRIPAGDGTAAAAVPLRGAGTPPPGAETPQPGGDRRVAVPAVIEKSLDTARGLLDDADLVPGTITRQASDNVAEGQIISSTPDPGSLVDRGSAVGLTVSSGPAPCFVPDVSGMARARAEQVIAQSCVTLGRVGVALSATQPPGVVIGISPGLDAPVPPGAAVSLTISERGVRVPQVVGMERGAAEAAIGSAGLEVGDIAFDGSRNDNTVKSSSPAAGQVVRPGDAVDLVVFGVVVE